jgi:hypothetical protein
MKTFFKLLASKIFEPVQKYSEKFLLSLFKNKFILKLFLVKDVSFLEFASERLKDDKTIVLTASELLPPSSKFYSGVSFW